eukprot:Phypoly_transcript_16380.p1 GENE.Phypoly_transcript_16380~~Phypoly_transcript_16380.p1  ORF type:complete len:170 (-),score=37.87 Phypoly_transcript_16380:328-837(-)
MNEHSTTLGLSWKEMVVEWEGVRTVLHKPRAKPPAKIIKSSPNTPGGPIKISFKIEQAKDGCFAHISSPPPCASTPSTPSLPVALRTSHDANDSDSAHECEWENCVVCDRDIPIMLQTQNPTWAAIMRVVFYSFMQIFPDNEYWKVRQAYKYIEDHWEKLCPGKTRMLL